MTIDRAALVRLEEMTGDRAFVQELLEEFIDDVRARVAELTAADATAPDRELIRRHAHTLKSSAANVGATSLSARSRALEAAADVADAATMTDLIDAVAAAATDAVRALEDLDDW